VLTWPLPPPAKHPPETSTHPRCCAARWPPPGRSQGRSGRCWRPAGSRRRRPGRSPGARPGGGVGVGGWGWGLGLEVWGGDGFGGRGWSGGWGGVEMGLGDWVVVRDRGSIWVRRERARGAQTHSCTTAHEGHLSKQPSPHQPRPIRRARGGGSKPAVRTSTLAATLAGPVP